MRLLPEVIEAKAICMPFILVMVNFCGINFHLMLMFLEPIFALESMITEQGWVWTSFSVDILY